MVARLITIWNSHYCDKARWALDRLGVPYVEEAHAPLFHVVPVKLSGGQRSTPVLVIDGQVLPDSTDILRWLDAHADRPGTLLGSTPEEAREVLDLEDRFDEDRIKEVVRANRDRSSREILDAIKKVVHDFSEHRPLEDNQTGLIIRRL